MVSGMGMQKQPPAFLMAEFSKYGISSSGDKDADLDALKEAKLENGEDISQIEAFEAQMEQMHQMKQAQGAEGQQGQGQGKGGQGAPPWSSLMSTLGIDPQGSKDADMAAIYEKLTEMASSAAGSPDQQSNLTSLLSQYEMYNNQ